MPQSRGAAQQASAERARAARLLSSLRGGADVPSAAVQALRAELEDFDSPGKAQLLSSLERRANGVNVTSFSWNQIENTLANNEAIANALEKHLTPSQARAAAVSEGTRAVQGRPPQRMAGSPAVVAAVRQSVASAPARPQVRDWTLSEGIDNGPAIGRGRQNDRGYEKSKWIKAPVDGGERTIMRIPYVEEKYADKARNARFEETRNPTREDVDLVASRLLQGARDAGINNAGMVLVPRRTTDSMVGQPMWHVIQRMQELSGGLYEVEPHGLVRTREAPTRTSIYDRGPSEDLSVVYSGHSPVVDVTAGIAGNYAAFAGSSALRDHFDRYGVGRNRSFSEDYYTLGAGALKPDRRVLLVDDSVGQGSSQLAAALKLHASNPGIEVTPTTYWGFANAPVRPKIELSRSMSAADVAGQDLKNVQKAVQEHRLAGQAFVDKAARYAGMAERQMRDDPIGNFLGGLFTLNHEYDQDKAKRYLEAYLDDPRQLAIAARMAAVELDVNDRAYQRRRLNETMGSFAR